MDLSADINVFDQGLTSVQWGSVAGAATINVVVQHVHEKEAAVSQGCYRKYYKSFYIPAIHNVIIGNTITDSDGTWTIIKLSKSLFNGPTRVAAINLNFNNWLFDEIAIYSPSYSTNGYADRILNPTCIASAVPCRVQPVQSNEDEEIKMVGKQGFIHKYNIYVDRDLDLPQGSYLVHTKHAGLGIAVENQKKYMIDNVSSRKSYEDYTILHTEVQL